jgi:hypothetical protein
MCFVGQFAQNLLQISKEKLQFNQFSGHVMLHTTLCHAETKQKIKKKMLPQTYVPISWTTNLNDPFLRPEIQM